METVLMGWFRALRLSKFEVTRGLIRAKMGAVLENSEA
jgi:hypothetical protein